MKEETRNPFGSIIPRRVTVGGKAITRYDARRRYTKLDGSRGEKSKRCRSKADAKAQLRNFDTEIQRELSGEFSNDHTFFELCDVYEKDYIVAPVIVGNRQKRGYRQSHTQLRRYVAEYRTFFGNVPLKSIGYKHVDDYAVWLASTPIKPGFKHKTAPDRLPSLATVNRRLAYLRRIFYIGIELRWIDRHPFKDGKALIDTNSEEPNDRALEPWEEEKILAACGGPDKFTYRREGRLVTATLQNNPRTHLKPVIIFAIDTGMRKREMFTTRRSQVNFADHIIELNARQTKALKKRTIPMTERLEAALAEMFDKNPFGKNDLIFAGLKDCDRAFATACRRAGIAGVTFHSLRHTAQTNMDEAGLPDVTRRKISGNTRQSGDRYVNPTASVLESARVKMNEFRNKLEEKRAKEAA